MQHLLRIFNLRCGFNFLNIKIRDLKARNQFIRLGCFFFFCMLR